MKRSVDELVAETADLTNANESFLKLSERSNSSVKFFFVPAREVDDADDSVPLRLSTVEGTMRIRQLGVLGLSKIWHRELSYFCKHPERCDCYTAAQHEFHKPAGADPTENIGERDVDSAVPEPEYVKSSEQIVGEWIIVITHTTGAHIQVVFLVTPKKRMRLWLV